MCAYATYPAGKGLRGYVQRAMLGPAIGHDQHVGGAGGTLQCAQHLIQVLRGRGLPWAPISSSSPSSVCGHGGLYDERVCETAACSETRDPISACDTSTRCCALRNPLVGILQVEGRLELCSSSDVGGNGGWREGSCKRRLRGHMRSPAGLPTASTRKWTPTCTPKHSRLLSEFMYTSIVHSSSAPSLRTAPRNHNACQGSRPRGVTGSQRAGGTGTPGGCGCVHRANQP
jgi:hypothetical protein